MSKSCFRFNSYVWDQGPNEAVLLNQELIIEGQQDILTAIANISITGGGGGDATQAKQDALQAEIEKLTKGVKTC